MYPGQDFVRRTFLENRRVYSAAWFLSLRNWGRAWEFDAFSLAHLVLDLFGDRLELWFFGGLNQWNLLRRHGNMPQSGIGL